ncbi:MAG: hypothetical protein M0D55_17280 [Elusimicrobiota bacterium]|nr:MAG: hypothetical protein M0D55_17280 [Elusimicrobiota bacterium]
MKCPNCAAEAADGSAECASCGVIFAKLKAKKERVVLEAKAGEALASTAPEEKAPEFNPWKIRAVAAAVVLAWLVGFGVYYRRAVSEALARRRLEVKERPAVMVRDPATGELKQVPVVTTPRRAAAPVRRLVWYNLPSENAVPPSSPCARKPSRRTRCPSSRSAARRTSSIPRC